MTLLVLLAMFGLLALVLLDGNWQLGLLITFLIGFVQDPLRKITPDQPSTMVGLVLVGFVLCTLVLLERRRGRFQLQAMFWAVPQLTDWVPFYFLLIFVQSLNSYARFNDPVLTALGIAFYIAPAIGLWVGFQVGCDQKLLRRLLVLYLSISALYAITVFLSYRGYEHPLLKEVGQGILITFRYGFQSKGASGLWRTSEIASWQLAAAACISVAMGLSSQKSSTQIGMLMLATGFGLLTITTGRRKALVLVLAFVGIYLLLFSRRASPASKERLITSVLGVAGVSYVVFSVFLRNALGPYFGEYVNRTASTKDELVGRFQGQGIGSILKGLEVSEGFGLGVGTGAQTGNLNVAGAAARGGIKSVGYVSEGGGGRLILELGIPGLIVLGVLAVMIALVLIRNFKLLRYLPLKTGNLLMGLLSFSLANIPSFISAAQLYGDPFVLIIIAVCLGSFLAVPTLAARTERQRQLIEAQANLRNAVVPQS